MSTSFFRNKSRVALIGGYCLLMGACTHANETVSLEQSVPSTNARMMALAPEQTRISQGRPIAMLPGEEVASVREHGYTNGLRQDVLLKGSAQHGTSNSITVLARSSRQQTLDETVPLMRPTEPAIRSEIGGQFLHIPMQISERDSSNAYGPYGLALGRGAGDVRCAYMWQWIDENRLPADAGITGPVTVRVRLCEAGTTFDAMAAEMDHLTIGVQPASAQTASNQPIAIIEAPAEAREPVALVRKQRIASHRDRHHVAMHHVHRARVARRQDREMSQPIAPIDAPAEVASGPRYMGAFAAATPAMTRSSMSSAPAVKLFGDLPAQAYLGPGTSQGASAAAKSTTAKYY